jgi:hypothetical protein
MAGTIPLQVVIMAGCRRLGCSRDRITVLYRVAGVDCRDEQRQKAGYLPH